MWKRRILLAVAALQLIGAIRRREDGMIKGGTGFSMWDASGFEVTAFITDQGSQRIHVDVRADARKAKAGASTGANSLVRKYLAALDARLR